MPRLFVAAWASDAVRLRAREVQGALRERGLALRFMEVEQLHATLAFLGRVHEARVGDVERACGAAASACEPFAVTIDCLGGFPTDGRAAVAWLGSRASADGFARTAQAVRARLRDAGVAHDEKNALAHVTIARAATAVDLPALDIPATPWRIAEIALVESQTLPDGSRYQTVRTWGLGA
ncbi:MAG TPA: RNA 2',3'-cyclic phosphodiesterase [Candidatus Dormibacteraeota bacterium]|nr:RNA 2',3'-cyclic phosphodiesterase [Candidatus Dormibacteraeota bacterium]